MNLFLLGIMMLFKPGLLWRIEHMFTVKNGEPTELYMTLMRIGGVVFIIVAVICTIVALLWVSNQFTRLLKGLRQFKAKPFSVKPKNEK